MIGDADPILPVLRADIEVIKGPAASDGGLTWLIHDPVKGTFDKASWDQVEILKRLVKRWRLSELVHELQEQTTLDIQAEELGLFIQGLSESGLLGTARVKDQAELLQEADAGKAGLLSEIFRHYLYFRIPLIYPDEFLRRTLKYVRPLGAPLAFVLYGLVLLLGLFKVGQQSETYLHTFGYFFNVKGMFAYGVSLVFLKIIHEFSHAYVSTALQCRVRTMGVAFMVMWPVAFCDVTDSWRLASRSKRLRISFAGVVAELVIAVFALLAWGMLSPGPLRSVCFILSSVTIASTLLVNLNPAMRFDGYYIFSDLFGIDNLQQTAFAHARGVIYRTLFGLPYVPVENYSSRQKVFMVIYSINTWIYRFGLYLGIAILVYYKFTKSLGIILFSAEIVFFLLKPIGRQLQMIWMMRKKMKPRRAIGLCIALGLWLSWCLIPLPRELELPAVTEQSEFQHVYVPLEGILTSIQSERDAEVESDQVLFTIESRKLLEEIHQLELEQKRLRLEINRLAVNASGKASLPAKREEIARSQMRLESLNQTLKQCEIKSVYHGRIYQWDESLEPQLSVKRGQLLCCVGNPQSLLVKAYVKEEDMGELPEGANCQFIDRSTFKRYKGRIRRCSPVRSHFIPYQSLTSVAGGDIAVVARGDKLEVLESYYEAEVELVDADSSVRINQVGVVAVSTIPRSLFRNMIDTIYSVFIRESAF